MPTYRHHSTAVTTEPMGIDGAYLVDYTGPLGAQSFDALRAVVVESCGDATALLIRVDRSLTVMGFVPPIPSGTYDNAQAPGAVVVRLDQLELWSEYGRALARLGVIRAFFLDSELQRAQAWAQRHALLSLAG